MTLAVFSELGGIFTPPIKWIGLIGWGSFGGQHVSIILPTGFQHVKNWLTLWWHVASVALWQSFHQKEALTCSLLANPKWQVLLSVEGLPTGTFYWFLEWMNRSKNIKGKVPFGTLEQLALRKAALPSTADKIFCSLRRLQNKLQKHMWIVGCWREKSWGKKARGTLVQFSLKSVRTLSFPSDA